MWRWCALLGVACAVQCPNSGVTNRTSLKLELNGVWKEVSGVAVSSQSFNGETVVWVHDDSGGVPALGLFSAVSGQLIQRFDLPNDPEIPFQDTEDIALGACGDSWTLGGLGSGDCIYLADSGDNDLVRTNLRIYKMKEPSFKGLTVGGTTAIQLPNIQILRFAYNTTLGAPTAHADCETIFVDSVGQEAGEAKGDVYLVTKWGGPRNPTDIQYVRLFRYPNSAQDGTTTVALQVASDAASLRATQWTRGDMSRDGSLIVIGGYATTRMWQRDNGTTIAAMFNSSQLCTSTMLTVPVDTEIQQEACAFTSVAPYVLMEIGECNAAATCNASLYRTPLLAITSAPSAAPSTTPTSVVNHASYLAVSAPLTLSVMCLFI